MAKTKEVKDPKSIKFIDGFSESAWKSLVVKSLRIGWVQGLEEAAKRLNKSTMKSLLHAGLFEDVFPAGYRELSIACNEIEVQDYVSLCSRETHHGRAYTDDFCDMEKDAVKNGRAMGYGLMNEIRANTPLTWLNPRVFNCLYTWHKISPKDTDVRRTFLNMPWYGMPSNILDAHTFEGKQRGTAVEMLSGHYHNHRAIGQEVMAHGWGPLRERFKADTIVEPIRPIHHTPALQLEL